MFSKVVLTQCGVDLYRHFESDTFNSIGLELTMIADADADFIVYLKYILQLAQSTRSGVPNV